MAEQHANEQQVTDQCRASMKERRYIEERAELGRRHAPTAQQLRNLYCAEYAHGLYKTSSDFSFRMDAEKGVTIAKQALR